MTIDLSVLDDVQLDALISKAYALKESRRVEQLNNARKEILRLAAEAGIELSDLVKGGAKQVKAVKKVAAKYRSPNDPSQTWTGRGRKPAWIESHLAAGGTMDDIAI